MCFTCSKGKPFNTSSMSSHLKIAKTPATLSKPHDTLKDEVMVDIEERGSEWDHLFIIKQSFIGLTKTD